MGLRILLCTSEAVPFAKTGGLADVAGALPPALAKLGHDVRLALPNYSAVDSTKFPSDQIGDPFDVPMGNRSVRVAVRRSDALEGVPTYLVDCPEYFDRDTLYGQPDDARRFAVFSRAVLEFLRHDEWKPDVIHGNDWQAGLIPVFLRTAYAGDPGLAKVGTLHTIHNLAYQGVFDESVLDEVGLDRSLFTMDGLEFYGQVSFLKGGLLYADLLSTVSEKYAEEIQTEEYGERLEGVLARRREDLFGILNGIDYEQWNPATDQLIAATYSADNLGPKGENKKALQKHFKLPQRPEVPMLGLVSRLAGQKGFDILAEVMPYILEMDAQFALLGTGEPYFHDLLSRLAKQYPNKMGLALAFDNKLAHQIYAGSDMFLMPSHYEPCGLGQMISLRYGTVPVVRSTGGLADTITDFKPETGKGNGFSFEDYTPLALFGTMARAILTYKAPESWSKVVQNGLASDFSWGQSAKKYADLYKRAADRRGR